MLLFRCYLIFGCVTQKTQYRPKVNQSDEGVSPKTASSIGERNVSTSGNSSMKTNMTNAPTSEEGKSSTNLVEKINMFEKQLMEGKCLLVDDDDKPLKKVDYFGDHGSEDEVERVDNEMASSLASKPSGVGYGTKSLLEQWRETYGSAEYDYDPYDDDMYEG
ncbi:hypothetical protein Tco_1326576 [Tanacetum coccineum]